MKNLLLIISLLVALPLYAQNGSISANKSTVSFTITNAGLDVDGKFTNITGSIVFDKNSLSNSKFTATIKVESIDT
ncbi:MAG: YceI family protein, partial [Bacteroidia bacterium]